MAMFMLATAALAGAAPVRVGECVTTRVAAVMSRLEGAPDSGSAIRYRNGPYQVSYDVVPGIARSRAGDRVRLCLASLPRHCPPGDDRGRFYRGTNLRTHASWRAADAEHMCGGA